MTSYINKEYYMQIPPSERHIIKLNNGRRANEFADRLRAEGIPFSAVISNYRNAVTVDRYNSERAEAIAAELAERQTENGRTIIGNTDYKYIKDKKYINTDPETAMHIADILSGNSSIRFSGVINGDEATITVSGDKNAAVVRGMIENYKNMDLIQELHRRGFERLPDTNGFVNIRNVVTNETCGFTDLNAVRQMFFDNSSEFFHPSAYRIAYREKDEDNFFYYIQRYSPADRNYSSVYKNENGPVIARSVDSILDYVRSQGISITNPIAELSQWREKDEIRQRRSAVAVNAEMINQFPMNGDSYLDLLTYNKDSETFGWVYFNPDGDNGNGEFIEKIITQEDIRNAYLAKLNAENESIGRDNFLNYLYENCAETVIEISSPLFAQYAERYINNDGEENSRFFGIYPDNNGNADIDKFIQLLENSSEEVKRDIENRVLPLDLDVIQDHIKLDDYNGIWYVEESMEIDGEDVFLLKSKDYENGRIGHITNVNGEIISGNFMGDLDDFAEKRYFEELMYNSSKMKSGERIGITEVYAMEMRSYGFDIQGRLDNCTAEARDMEYYSHVIFLADIMHDISEKHHIDGNSSLDIGESHSNHLWNDYREGRTVYDNVVLAVLEENYQPIEEYIKSVKELCDNSENNEYPFEKRRMKELFDHFAAVKSLSEERGKTEEIKPLQTIEIDRYSEPDEKHRVSVIGTKTFGEVFAELEKHLQDNDLMPDEYFTLSFAIDENAPVPSDWRQFSCNTNFGGSEGIYTDISLKTESGTINFATGKTLGDTVEDFVRMSRIGAECSMLLNGNGSMIRRSQEIIPSEKFPNGELTAESEIAEDPAVPEHQKAVELLTERIPDLTKEKALQLVSAFDNAALPDWTDSQVKINRIKKAIYDILDNEDNTEIAFALISKSVYDFDTDSLDLSFADKDTNNWFTESELLGDFVAENPNISFALANAMIEYLDEKQNTERAIENSKVGWYKKTDFNIKAVIDGEAFTYEGRFDIGDGKEYGGGSMIDHIRTFNENILKSELYPYNQKEQRETAKRNLEIFIPFLEKNSALSAEEEKVLAEFKEKYPIRSAKDFEQKSDISEVKDNIEISAIVSDFRENTRKAFVPIDGLTFAEIESMATEKAREIFAENGIEAEVKAAVLAGSRSRGLEKQFSDIDVVIEVSSELKEDALFNILNEEPLVLNGIKVDINPIRAEETGTLDVYLPKAESYLKGKHYVFLEEKFDTVKKNNPELSPRANEILDRIISIMVNNNIRTLNDEVINAPAMQIRYGGITLLDKVFDGKFADIVNQINAAIHNENEYDTTIRLINEYCEKEFEEQANFSNKDHVPLAYTTDEITEEPIEVYANLENMSVVFEYGGVPVKKELFESYAEMNVFLANMSFDELVAVSDEERSQYDQLSKKNEEQTKQTINNAQETQKEPETGNVTIRKAGDFWECYGESARIAANILDITLMKKNGEDMCGFPDFKKDEYCQKLRDAGCFVMVEEVYNLNPSKQTEPEKTEVTEENFPMGNYNPKLNDIIEFEGELYKIADVSGGYLTLQETESLIPATRSIAISSLLSSDFSVLSEADSVTSALNMEDVVSNSPMGNLRQDNSANFVITNDDFGAVGGAKTRFTLNVEAIRLLKSIESENRAATPDEQQILSKYTGWGAIPQAFDPNNEKWKKEYDELKELLTQSEYSAARQSTMNAHYTAPIVISAIYNALENMGFENGKILEPSMGIGNFFGRLPESMQDSKLYGVELDSITGRIAKQLYPQADIQIKGFERTKFPDNFFDVAVSNVPFGDYKLNDKRYNDLNLNIHDYFFAKALDKVHAGGIVAFVTSKGTLDKENPEVRKYLAEKAEFLGAIRLPNNASKANAGTEVTADIIFLQKRERPITIDPDTVAWVSKAENADGFSINKYFVEHPEMVLGKIVEGNKLYGSQTNDTSCIPIEGADLKEQLAEAVKNIKGRYKAAEKEVAVENNADEIPAPENARKFSYYAENGNLYYLENSDTMKKVNAPTDTINRVFGLIEIRDTVRELLDLQLNNTDKTLDGEIAECRQKLNKIYDSFKAKYGEVSNKKNAKAMKGDNGYSIISALELKDDKGKVIGKADIFTKNTMKPKIITAHVDTAEEALILSVSEKGKIDFDFMTELCGMDKEKMIEQLDGQIFRLPQEKEKYVTADEYLSGNIRKKMTEIENCYAPKEFEKNYNALQAAMPPRVEAKDISVKLGSHWVDTKYIRQFIDEKFKPDPRTHREMNVTYSAVTGMWKIDGVTGTAKTNHLAMSTFGTYRRNAYDIIETILNNGDLTVKDRKKDEFGNDMKDDKGRYILIPNDEETKAARQCANLIKSEFADWIFKDPERREDLVQKYNDTYNSFRYREYDGSHLNFVGMNTDITLKDHQKNAIARGLYGGNTLLAHAVGAGKTFEMVAIAMEGKRLGLHNKSLFAVPNSLTEQIGNDFRKLYPNANILVATKKDFEKENRLQLLANIAANDWDAVIVGHSQFDRMGLSPERETAYIQAEVEKLRNELENIKANDPASAKSFSVKQIEKTLKSYSERLDKLKDAQVKDDFIDFEQLGFDKIFVDESHMYKNLATPTKMRNVSGLGSRGSARAFNLLMKAKYLDELTGGKGCIFASGTPEYTP